MKNAWSKLVDIIQEDVIGTGNRVIAIAWTVCLTLLIAVGFYLSSESMSFLGVAGSRELQINFEYPVEIKRVHVIPGQTVAKGDLLIELDQSELNGKIRLVRSTLTKLQAEIGVRRTLNKLLSNREEMGLSDPLAVEIEDLVNEMSFLERQRKNLFVFAGVDGIVGGVAAKEGEKVPSFVSLVTLSPRHPTYVDGFLHENLPTRLEIGRPVTVAAVTSRAHSVQGRVISVGSRIVMMPARLLIYPTMQVWGREVVVEIPTENSFLLGEKVQIKPNLNFSTYTNDFWPLGPAQANENKKAATPAKDTSEHKPEEFNIPAELEQKFHLEPSGAIFLEDMNKFLIVSDDTDKKSATLVLADRDGRINNEVLVVPGAGRITDMESISQSGDMVYVLSSQGFKKSGKEQVERGMFLRFKRTGLEISAVASVHLKPLLVRSIATSKDPKLKAAFRGLKAGDMEIESHFVDGPDLYLGFKFPMNPDAQSLILIIRGFESIFKSRTITPNQLAVSQWIDFGHAEGSPHQLSDLIRVNGSLYATTVCHGEDCGAVWKIERADRANDRILAQQVKFYRGLRPEGLAYDNKNSSLFVTFDQQDEAPKFNRIVLPEN